LVFAMSFPTLATWCWFVLLSGAESMKLVFALSKIVQFAFPAAWVLAVERVPIRIPRVTPAGLGLGAGFGMVVVAAMLGLYYGGLRRGPLLADAPAQIAEKLRGFAVTSGFAFFGLAAFYSLLHSLLEEYYWRWFVFGRLRGQWSIAAAVALSSVAFTAHHVLVVGAFLKGYGPATWFFSSCVGVGGAVWAWLYHRSGTLYGAWLSHLLVDAGIMWMGYDLWSAAR
jgi:hypothetical protein